MGLDPDLIILTPMNIKKYLPDFPIDMKKDSEIPLKKRIDILYAFILDSYGGLCISPGTVVINIDEILSKIKKSLESVRTKETSSKLSSL